MSKSLAMAYNMKRKASKKMAKGGEITTAKAEARPMPAQKANDSTELMQNSHMKPREAQDQMLEKPDYNAPRSFKVKKMHTPTPKSSAFNVRYSDAKMEMAEGGAVPSLEQAKKPMPKADKPVGNTLDYAQLRKEHAAKNRKRYADGGMIDPEDENHIDPAAEADEDPMFSPNSMEDMGDEDNYMSDHMPMLAHGGDIDEEDEIDKAASIAAAIMARKEMKRMASGGMVDIDSNNEEQPNAYEDANEAVLKENYDEDMDSVVEPLTSHGDPAEESEEDEHDHIDKMRNRMKMRSPFTR